MDAGTPQAHHPQFCRPRREPVTDSQCAPAIAMGRKRRQAGRQAPAGCGQAYQQSGNRGAFGAASGQKLPARGGEEGETRLILVTTPWNRTRNKREGRLAFDSSRPWQRRGEASEQRRLLRDTPSLPQTCCAAPGTSLWPRPRDTRSGQRQPQWVDAERQQGCGEVRTGTSQPQLIVPDGEEDRKGMRGKPWSSTEGEARLSAAGAHTCHQGFPGRRPRSPLSRGRPVKTRLRLIC